MFHECHAVNAFSDTDRQLLAGVTTISGLLSADMPLTNYMMTQCGGNYQYRDDVKTKSQTVTVVSDERG